MEVLRNARTQLAELTGMAAENVSSFEQTEDGWSLEIEVLELSRVPDTMSLMASYQVDLDPDGQLTGYRRVRRYERGRADATLGGTVVLAVGAVPCFIEPKSSQVYGRAGSGVPAQLARSRLGSLG